MTDKQLISNQFNNFFVNIGNNLTSLIGRTKKSPVGFMGNMVTSSIFLEPVSLEEMFKIINSLKNGAPGYDGITADIMKCVTPYIATPLVYLCNCSLDQGVFPSELKIANVIPLYKSGDPLYFSNYRPVSLLSVLSKVFEKVMYNRLLSFLNKYKVLIDTQFGFRKLHSSYMALLLMVDQISKAIENGNFIVGIFLDFSKAFDTVNHTILLSKLYHCGIRGKALEWFTSYLYMRQQFVTYNNIKSSYKYITCGVPQGSILGPLLFLIYINDLHNVCKHSSPILFADDSNLFFTGSNASQTESLINEELSNISEWLKANKLSLNIKKTHYIIFKQKRKILRNFDIRIDNELVVCVKNTKFLGVVIDESLTWKNHICYISGKIARGIGMLIKARQLLNKDSLVTLYYSFLYPYFTYCNIVWGATYATSLNRLNVLQKRAIRVVCGIGRYDSTAKLFDTLGIIRFPCLNVYLISKFMYRWQKSTLPIIFNDFYKLNKEIHQYNTRQTTYLNVPTVKINLRKFNIRYRGSIIWNSILGSDLKINVSEAVFMKSLRIYIKNNLLNLNNL